MIQNFPNALYIDYSNFYQEYIKNYNEKGLKNLKKQNEKIYGIKLQFTDNFLQFPKFVGKGTFHADLTFDDICPYFRKNNY